MVRVRSWGFLRCLYSAPGSCLSTDTSRSPAPQWQRHSETASCRRTRGKTPTVAQHDNGSYSGGSCVSMLLVAILPNCHILRYNSVQSVESQSGLRGNKPHASSGQKNKPMKIPERMKISRNFVCVGEISPPRRRVVSLIFMKTLHVTFLHLLSFLLYLVQDRVTVFWNTDGFIFKNTQFVFLCNMAPIRP